MLVTQGEWGVGLVEDFLLLFFYNVYLIWEGVRPLLVTHFVVFSESQPLRKDFSKHLRIIQYRPVIGFSFKFPSLITQWS